MNAHCPGTRPRPSLTLGQDPCARGPGPPVNLIYSDTCHEILQGLRGADSQLSSFDSDPGSPPPALEAEVAHGERAT